MIYPDEAMLNTKTYLKLVIIAIAASLLSACASLPERLLSNDSAVQSKAVLEFSASKAEKQDKVMSKIFSIAENPEHDEFTQAVCLLASYTPEETIYSAQVVSELIKVLQNNCYGEVCSCAMHGLAVFGKENEAAYNALLNEIKHGGGSSNTAADALSEIGAPIIPKITVLLRSNDKDDRSAAYMVLWRMGHRAESAVPKLYELLQTMPQKDGERTDILDLLGRLGPSGEAAIKNARNGNDRPHQEYIEKSRANACSLIERIVINPEDASSTAALQAMLKEKPDGKPSWQSGVTCFFDLSSPYASLGCKLGQLDSYFKCH